MIGTKYDAVAADFLEAAVGPSETLRELDPSNLAWRFGLARVRRVEGMLLRKRKQLKEAGDKFLEARDLAASIAKDQPAWRVPVIAVGTAYYYEGEIAKDQGQYAQSEAAYLKSFHLNERYARDAMGSFDYARNAAIDSVELATIASTRKKDKKLALNWCERGLGLMNALAAPAQESMRYREIEAWLQEWSAIYNLDLGSRQAALAAYKRALMVHEELARSNPAPGRHITLAEMHIKFANAQLGAKAIGEAEDHYEASLKAIEDGLRRFPNHPELLAERVKKSWDVAQKRLDNGDLSGARRDLEKAASAAEKIDRYHPSVIAAIRNHRGQRALSKRTMSNLATAGHERRP